MSQGNPSEGRADSAKREDRSAVSELLREAIGYEQGLWRTLVDLRKQPIEVLEGYLNKTGKYTSPFKLLTSFMSLWILINSFLINWYAIWKQLATDTLFAELKLVMWIGDFDDQKRGAVELKATEFARTPTEIIAQVAGDMFSKWYVPFVVIVIIGGCFLFVRQNKDSIVSLKKAMAIMSYSVGSSMIIYLGVTLSFAIHPYFGIGITFMGAIIMLTGRAHWIIFAPMRAFFVENGKSQEKALMKSMFVVTLCLQLVLIAGYIVYYTYIV